MAKRLIKMWITPETLKNINLKQLRIKQDLGIIVPKSKIAYALSRQPLIPDEAGIDLRKLAKRRRI